MIKGTEKSLVIWSFRMLLKRILKTISHISSLWTQSEFTCGRGGHYPGVKCPPHPPQPSCMPSFLCDNQREWEEPGHLKFLNALQEDAWNNFSYLIPMNIVSVAGVWGERGVWMGGGDLPQGKVFPPPHLNPHVRFHFYVMIKGIEKSLVIWKFLNALQDGARNISPISSLRT